MNQQYPNQKPKLVLDTVYQVPPVLGLEGAIRPWVFPFRDPQMNLIIFSLNVIADTPEHAAVEVRELLSAMLIEVSMQFPQTTTGLPIPVPQFCKCGFSAQSIDLLNEHMKAVHPNGI